MEIHFSEIENTNQNPNQNPYSNPEKYWETPVAPKKKKVSFDDILSNMNIVVNKSGVLQFMQPLPPLQDEMIHQQQPYQQQQPYNQQQPLKEQPYQEYVAQQLAKKQNAPLDPLVKNSFIYNKYFKDYKEATTTPEIRVPKTIEEYKKMLHDDRIARLEQQKRIAEIKSTKLMFTTNDSSSIQKQPPIISTKNKLRSMNFY
jgi:hypothetical protein